MRPLQSSVEPRRPRERIIIMIRSCSRAFRITRINRLPRLSRHCWRLPSRRRRSLCRVRVQKRTSFSVEYMAPTSKRCRSLSPFARKAKTLKCKMKLRRKIRTRPKLTSANKSRKRTKARQTTKSLKEKMKVLLMRLHRGMNWQTSKT